MLETNEKAQELNNLLNRRNYLLNVLKLKEDVATITQNKDDNLVIEFENALKECKDCDVKIKQYKLEVSPIYFVKFEDNSEYKDNNDKYLIVKKQNKIINWFKSKINEFRYNYNVERAIKRDNFIEENITNQISSYNAYLNVIKVNGNKAIFQKSLNDIKEDKI